MARQAPAALKLLPKQCYLVWCMLTRQSFKCMPRRSPLAGVDVNAAGVPGLDREGISGDDCDVVALEADGGVHQLSATNQPDAVGGVGLDNDLLVGAACSGGQQGVLCRRVVMPPMILKQKVESDCTMICSLQWWICEQKKVLCMKVVMPPSSLRRQVAPACTVTCSQVQPAGYNMEQVVLHAKTFYTLNLLPALNSTEADTPQTPTPAPVVV